MAASQETAETVVAIVVNFHPLEIRLNLRLGLFFLFFVKEKPKSHSIAKILSFLVSITKKTGL